MTQQELNTKVESEVDKMKKLWLETRLPNGDVETEKATIFLNSMSSGKTLLKDIGVTSEELQSLFEDYILKLRSELDL